MMPLNILSVKPFYITHISSRMETWQNGFVVDNLQSGRQMNLIHIITCGRRSYRAYGRQFELESGTVLLIPHGTQYMTKTESLTSGIGVCFDLSDQISLAPGIYCDWFDKCGDYLHLFQSIHDSMASGVQDALHCQAVLLRILDKMNRENAANTQLQGLLEPGLRYIETHCCENVSVAEYAAACHLSESYFRRKFLQYTGMTPIAYRDNLRFRLAHRRKAEGMSTAQIAASVGFCDVSYFRKIYKKHFGVSFFDNEMPEII